MDEGGTTTDLDELREFVEYKLRSGFYSVPEIVEETTCFVTEVLESEDLLPEIPRVTAELVAAHRAEEAAWDEATDCDRLDQAFEALNDAGIVARHNFSCCNNCGFTEIRDEIQLEEVLHPVIGYVFYHLQATEAAVENGLLRLAYGAVEEDPAALVCVAERVVRELKEVGLNASWQGSGAQPIVVRGLRWRRRQFSSLS